MNDEGRLMDDHLPIQPISAQALREKSLRRGHISKLPLWRALVAPDRHPPDHGAFLRRARRERQDR